MYALTIWQPWASLIMIGAKPFEFRRWPPPKHLVGRRIVIHAGARAVKSTEILDLLTRLDEPAGGGTGLRPELARPLLERLATAHSSTQLLPLGCGLGTALLDRGRRAAQLFSGDVADSTRIDPHVYAWPLSEIRRFDAPVPARGAQGIWRWRDEPSIAAQERVS